MAVLGRAALLLVAGCGGGCGNGVAGRWRISHANFFESITRRLAGCRPRMPVEPVGEAHDVSTTGEISSLYRDRLHRRCASRRSSVHRTGGRWGGVLRRRLCHVHGVPVVLPQARRFSGRRPDERDRRGRHRDAGRHAVGNLRHVSGSAVWIGDVHAHEPGSRRCELRGNVRHGLCCGRGRRAARGRLRGRYGRYRFHRTSTTARQICPGTGSRRTVAAVRAERMTAGDRRLVLRRVLPCKAPPVLRPRWPHGNVFGATPFLRVARHSSQRPGPCLSVQMAARCPRLVCADAERGRTWHASSYRPDRRGASPSPASASSLASGR